MYTAIYMSKEGVLKEKKFETHEETTAFFKELAKTDIPMRKFEDKPKALKTRLEEVNMLCDQCWHKLSTLGAEARETIKAFVKYEIERDSLKKSKYS